MYLSIIVIENWVTTSTSFVLSLVATEFTVMLRLRYLSEETNDIVIGPVHDSVTWYGINYAGTQVTKWDFQNKGTCNSPARLSFVLEVPLRNLRLSIIYSVPCDRIVQRAYLTNVPKKGSLYQNSFLQAWSISFQGNGRCGE